ncbi:hypothetical protein appser13_17590 [Actinobacillus pleuropneumoniae serovar 13 str. N273]|nr:hypothetical protein appser2_16930 [Actinobacillus pleuropneumoniae serovar 2 str. S1536]EFN02074.1 hypothetical protein appser13_17590 [Actinobacillus pleuropneumoniae serovar 13 str. N273]
MLSEVYQNDILSQTSGQISLKIYNISAEFYRLFILIITQMFV